MAELAESLQDLARVRVARAGEPTAEGDCVLYWMERSQRGRDNAALNLAIEWGNALNRPVLTVFALDPHDPKAQRRQDRFLLDGLVDVRSDLQARGVPLILRVGEPSEVVLALAAETRPALVVGDENPLREARAWRAKVADRLTAPFRIVDADVVVPSSLFPKDEWSARTFRVKLHKVWDAFLKPISNPKAKIAWSEEKLPRGEPIDPSVLIDRLGSGGAGEIADYRGGSVEAARRLDRFLRERLFRYASDRNEPTPPATSELSAHLRFGQIGPLTVALAVRSSDAPRESIDAFLEELIVRRELAINFVARNPDYDSPKGRPRWACETLRAHRGDPRTHLYSLDRFEAAETHDPLWNAAQTEMVVTGRMHNYLRMYWAKKILDWSPDAETAFEIALDLNDRYEMDGRDPNGYEGIAWAIGGKHDRPWPERPVFGTVRFMSFESTRKKFDSAAYIERVARESSKTRDASSLRSVDRSAIPE